MFLCVCVCVYVCVCVCVCEWLELTWLPHLPCPSKGSEKIGGDIEKAEKGKDEEIKIGKECEKSGDGRN